MLTVRRELLCSARIASSAQCADNVDSLSVSGEEEESIKSNLKQSRSLRSIKNHESLQTQLIIKIFFFFKNFKQRLFFLFFISFFPRVVCVASRKSSRSCTYCIKYYTYVFIVEPVAFMTSWWLNKFRISDTFMTNCMYILFISM